MRHLVLHVQVGHADRGARRIAVALIVVAIRVAEEERVQWRQKGCARE